MLSQVIFASVVAYFMYLMATMLYRLLLSPLSNIPGPKLAAVTQGYEMYYDLILKARFPWKIQELHEKFGKSIPLI